MRSRLASLLLLSLITIILASAGPAFGADRVQQALGSELAKATAPTLDALALRAFYAGRDNRPAWCTDHGCARTAKRWVAHLRAAGEEGLVPEDYHLSEIARLWPRTTPAERARLDVLLSDAYFRYATHLRAGRILPHDADPQWFIPTASVNPVAELEAALAAHDFDQSVRALAPPYAGYRALRDALARYRVIAARGGWSPLPAGPRLEPGESHAQIPLLRARLHAEGDWRGNLSSKQFDPALAAAVMRFQARHGLLADGVVGGRTRAALDVPVNARIDEIAQNLERWRWLPRPLGDRYILVNSGGFILETVEHGRVILTMRVITGKPEQPTPSLQSRVESVVINPYWYVPARIAREDLLPRQQDDAHFFSERGMRVLGDDGRERDPASIDWSRVTAADFPYRLRQDPGPKNSLGRLKFVFPNPFDVFLHDTPEHGLFVRDVRTFSSGCIRLEQPIALAKYLLEKNGWTEQKIRAAIDGGTTQSVRVPDPITIYVVYWTAWADEDGTVHFRDDVYHRNGFPTARRANGDQR